MSGNFSSWRATLVFFCFIFVWTLQPQSVAAQQVGVSIEPALIEETLDPGVHEEHTVTIKNLNNSEQTFFLFTRNISDVRDGSVPVFADEGEETGMELSDWIVLPVSSITLPAGGSERITFQLNLPEDASPGSHFGSVFISVDAPEIEKSGAAVGYQVGNIISIRVTGEVVEEASIRQFSTNKFFYGSQNVDFSAKIENVGNVLVRPIGLIEIENMLGQKVDTVNFNKSQGGVFPHRSQEFASQWTGDSIGFGRYEAVLSASYGDVGAKKTMSSTVSFWILPLHIIGPALGVLAVLLLVTFIFVRMYISRTLAHLTQGSTRIVHRRRRSGPPTTLFLTVALLFMTAFFLIILLTLFA
ncbi:MAG: hypothetical protein AAB388_00785 [Patescibacteria group bacterium]